MEVSQAHFNHFQSRGLITMQPVLHLDPEQQDKVVLFSSTKKLVGLENG